MLGEDQRYQNGFDCQGLWVEVNVERELGFTSKRDIEALRHRPLREPVQAARPDLRRAADRAVDPPRACGWTGTTRTSCAGCATCWPATRPRSRRSRARTARSPTPSRCSSAAWACPSSAARTSRSATRTTTSSGASSPSATGAAGCTRATTRCRGARAAARAISQMEMNEGYQDREDPGLTVRFPLVDRPGESLLVWTTTPWTLTANVAAAVGPDLRYVRVRQGDDRYWVGKGTLKTALQGRSRSRTRSPARTSSAGATAGPFDELPAVRTAFARRRGYEHRVVRLGRGRRGRGHRHRPHRARAAAPRTTSSARRSACRSSRRSTRTAATSTASAG